MGELITSNPWLFGLLFKPVIGIAMLLFFFGGARFIAWLLWHVIPSGAIKRALFRPVRADVADDRSTLGQGALQHLPVLRGHRLKD